jgi:putative SOS response-associated peptidase YedK
MPSAAATLCSRHVWPCPSLLRCQRDQAGLLNPAHRPTPNIALSWNVAPTDPLPIIRYDAKAGERSLDDPFGLGVNVREANLDVLRPNGTRPQRVTNELHNRMPVVLKPDVWSEWLGEEHAGPPRLKALHALCTAEEMVAWPVSPRVGNVKNNDASLIEPFAGAA